MKSPTLVIVQARMGSTRYPGKSLAQLGDKPLIDHVIQRALNAVEAENIIVATTNLGEDDSLVQHIQSRYKLGIFRGSAFDVRSRFISITEELKPNYIVRLTADDPFKDPQLIRDVIEVLEAGKFDYVSNFAKPCLPVGLDVEGFTAEALKDSERRFSDELNREHVTIGLRESGLYRTISLNYPEIYPNVRLTLDTVQDLTNLTKVYNKLRRKNNVELFDYTSTCTAISESMECGEKLD
jgi:spore coat polysaccharide biosynthesis protein SpsF (cytidylyltransferase family)